MPMKPDRTGKLRHTLLSRLHQFGAQEAGATAVIAAILFPVVIGGMGLGAETGYWYLTQRKLQHIADVSVHAAGVRQRAGDTHENIEAAAVHVAAESGYLGTPPLIVNIPPQKSVLGFAGDPDSVEVIATETQARLFSAVVMGFFSNEPNTTVTMIGYAVAKVEPTGSVACVLALHPTASGAATVSGQTSLGLENCDVASNSNANNSFLMDGSNAVLSTGCVYAVGRAITSNGLTLTQCAEVKEHAPKVRDPYADVIEPTNPGNCKSRHQGHPTQPSAPLTPGCYNGLTVKGALHFEPGVYFINGGEFNVNSGDNAKLTGTGVTFYLANGANLNIGGSIQMNFSAPTDPANPYAGIVFFGARNATTTTHKLAGSSESDYTGAIYTPASLIEFSGSSKTGGGGCTQIIGARVKFTGASSLKSTCADAGTSDIHTNETVKIVE